MGTVYFRIYDLEAGGFALLTMSFSESGTEPQGSVPNEVGKDYRRAIVRHPIPGLDRDIGQDMGAHSREYPIGGLCKADIRSGLEARFLAAQFTAANPGGRFRIQSVDSDGVTIIDVSGVVFDSYSWRFVPGMPDWFRYALRFVEFQGQT
jgi:hypothetical protein